MSTGAFRDASAAIERAVMLEQQNEELRTELEELAKLRVDVEELNDLRSQVDELRAIARSENEGAYMKRLSEEREELATEVRSLRERLAAQESELARLRIKARQASALTGYAGALGSVEPLVTRVLAVFARK